GWYLTGYPVGGDVRRALSVVATLDELETIVDGLDPTMVALAAAVGTPRGTQAGPQQVTLPAGWLDHRDDLTPPPALADALVSGG
ncbi:MAG: tRNA dihydrouridine synthase DusB, partial [Acidimicrobiales bacterium]